MKGILYKLRIQKSLSAKITWMNVSIILLIFITLIIATVSINYQLTLGNEKQKMNVYISNTLSSIDNKLKDMGRVSLMTYSDERTQEILKSYNSYEYAKQLESVEYLRKLYTSLITIREDINSVYLFDLDSLIFWQDNMDPSQRRNYDMSSFIKKMEEWERREKSVSGCRLVVGTQPDFMRYSLRRLENEDTNHCIYLVRGIKSFSPNEQIGHIVLITNMEDIRDVLNEYLDDEVEYTLLTEEGDIVCDEASICLGKNMKNAAPEIYYKMNGSSGVFQENINGVPWLITYQKSDYSGMILVTRRAVGLIWKDAMRFIGITVIIFVILLGITVWLTFHGTKRMLRPLKFLSDSMAHFDQDDMGMRFVVTTQDETGQLVASFNNMMDIINQLIESEYEGKVRLKEAELKQQRMSLLYLKNQINPHFLYNTLDTIRIKAELNGDRDVAAMIMQMVDFFRLSVKADSQMVTVSHEIRLIQAYLKLMCCRYPQLICEYEIDETLLQVEMPNFILQPLIENSVMHGLRAVGYRGKVKLSVCRDEENEEKIIIKIYDNGAGMSRGTKSLLENVLKNAGDESCETGSEEMHIGIVNVQRRLKMFYPDTAGLSYQDNPEGGVTVTLIINNNLEREGMKK